MKWMKVYQEVTKTITCPIIKINLSTDILPMRTKGERNSRNKNTMCFNFIKLKNNLIIYETIKLLLQQAYYQSLSYL